jgi:hypothetical protein
MAVIQIRQNTAGRAYYRRKRAAGKFLGDSTLKSDPLGWSQA